jgi:hypothetical protein
MESPQDFLLAFQQEMAGGAAQSKKKLPGRIWLLVYKAVLLAARVSQNGGARIII